MLGLPFSGEQREKVGRNFGEIEIGFCTYFTIERRDSWKWWADFGPSRNTRRPSRFAPVIKLLYQCYAK